MKPAEIAPLDPARLDHLLEAAEEDIERHLRPADFYDQVMEVVAPYRARFPEHGVRLALDLLVRERVIDTDQVPKVKRAVYRRLKRNKEISDTCKKVENAQ